MLDPFAGTGLIHKLGRDLGWQTTGVEIEPEWAAMAAGTLTGDATDLPFASESFNAIVTSPVYGNRMSDHHDARERCKPCCGNGLLKTADAIVVCEKCEGTGSRQYRRNTYKHALNRIGPDGRVADLNPRNAGAMQFGSAYRALHEQAWAEATRVASSWFVLSISDHIRKGQIVPVTSWHLTTLSRLGWTEVERESVDTPRNRYGANRDLRAECEWVVLLRKANLVCPAPPVPGGRADDAGGDGRCPLAVASRIEFEGAE